MAPSPLENKGRSWHQAQRFMKQGSDLLTAVERDPPPAGDPAACTQATSPRPLIPQITHFLADYPPETNLYGFYTRPTGNASCKPSGSSRHGSAPRAPLESRTSSP
ncbi:hypothetical protein FRC12_024708 [Ceratobasidium sp. 428]|nr:hypothetical protein FRC09_003784 [Ceratobasidium sp. 395]KAG8778962.1 hypothetical protein FRC12_024708 [Ceratobasidium sp. 428]